MKSAKYYYFKYVFRPSRTIKLSFLHLYGRIILFLALKGFKVPGLNKIKNKLPKNAKDIFERQLLIYEIKGERFSLRLGPIWFRKYIDQVLLLFQKNKFWLMIILKTLVAIIFVLIPIAFFILLRGILPVPERVSYGEIKNTLPIKSYLKTNWFYTEGPFYSNKLNSGHFLSLPNTRGLTLTQVLEPNAPKGLFHFGIGLYPNHLSLIRGYLAGESGDLLIHKIHSHQVSINAENKLRIQYFLLPSKNSNNYKCQITFKDQNHKEIASVIEITPEESFLKSEKGFYKAWQELFIPNSSNAKTKVKEIQLNLEQPPEFISATVTSLMNVSKIKSSSLKSRDLSDDECVFALGDFSYESVEKESLPRRGIVFILIDTLRADTAYDPEIMPNLNHYASNSALKFLEHRAQGNMTVPSVTSFMTSRYARDVGSIAFTYAADSKMRENFYASNTKLMPLEFQNLGYRVGGIGWLSLFSEAMEGGVDLGFHNAIISENSAYESRHITEKMGEWLENYGQAPFFLYLHYNTMHGPYKPPFSNINLKEFLSKPLGLNQRKQLYNALGRHWDNEFLNIIQKLKDLGLYEDVDIIVTADHGAQFYNQPWDNLTGVEQGLSGGYADKGHSLLDEEVRVPFILHLAHESHFNGSNVIEKTAHVDLFPTLYHLAGGDQPVSNWRGIDLYPGFMNQEKPFHELLKNRKFIYFDGHRYAGLLYWGGKYANSPRKYIRQLDPDDVKLYLTHNPWSKHIRWFQPEIFTQVSFENHIENWVSNLPGQELRDLRKIYFDNAPSHHIIRLISKYNGTFKVRFSVKKINFKEKSDVLFDLLPTSIKVFKEKNQFILSGDLQKEDSIWIHLKNSRMDKINFEDSITPILCQNGNGIENQDIPKLLEGNVCPFFKPPQGIVEDNYLSIQKPIVIQKALSNEQVEQLEGKGAGEALQNALREWGYAK